MLMTKPAEGMDKHPLLKKQLNKEGMLPVYVDPSYTVVGMFIIIYSNISEIICKTTITGPVIE